MKLNHLNLAVDDVPAARQFLERAFDFRAVGEGHKNFQILLDDDGFVLTLMGVGRDNTVSYPKTFHIGFIQPSDAHVDAIYQRLKGYRLALALAVPAWASVASEQQEGARVLSAVHASASSRALLFQRPPFGRCPLARGSTRAQSAVGACANDDTQWSAIVQSSLLLTRAARYLHQGDAVSRKATRGIHLVASPASTGPLLSFAATSQAADTQEQCLKEEC